MRDILAERARTAGLGRVLRVHRELRRWRGPLWLVAVVGWVGLTLFFTEVLDWRVALVGFVAVCWLAFAWRRWSPVPGGRRWYAVAEGGVLALTGPGDTDFAEPWPELSFDPKTATLTTSRGLVRTLPADLGGRVGLRFTLAAGRAVPPPAGRWIPRGLAGLATALTVWFALVPLTLDLVFGEVPRTVAEVSRICAAGPGFGRAAPYQGPGPHQIVVWEGDTDDDPDYTAPAHGLHRDSPAGSVQLVGCLHDLGHPRQAASLDVCQYEGDFTTTVYQGRYQLAVYEVRTGTRVAVLDIPGSTAVDCAPFISTGVGDTGGNADQDTEPADSTVPAALADLVGSAAKQ